MVSHSVSWCLLVYVSWCFMLSYGVSQCVMVSLSVSWCLMVSHSVSWCLLVSHDVSCVLWCLIIPHNPHNPSLPSALVRGFEWGIYSRNVHAYVHTYVPITHRNVNLRSRPGRILNTMCINTRRRRDDMFWWRWTGRTAQLGLRSVRIWRSHVQERVLNTAGRLVTLTKKKKQEVSPL